ncbi:Ig-like domain-containing protein [uncultured Porphyromonas sp.]|uniref:Ig-like domain-containing protein n=1 Tax=uncultured Porphyromonas sp. TaxID=159274 RepID=UPI00260872CE|nr:Ig-like domain-containing protein [uncultured Porphyromonas sp.]
MRKLTVILSMLLMVVGLGSCKKDKNEPTAEPTKITLDASTLSLSVGESKQLKAIVLPKDQKFTVDYKSDKPEVATVDAKGLVTAVAEGTAKVTATVGKLSAECVVTVTKKGGGSTTQGNELPLLKFEIEGDENTITDAEVIAHEQKVGRVAEDVMIGQQGPFAGFANKNLTIPAVAYGLGFSNGALVIAAVAKEPMENCPKTTAMLAEYGFTNLEDGTMNDGTPYRAALKDDNKNIFVRLTDLPRKDGYGATMQIEFVKVPEKKDITIAHAVIPDVKDFPDYKTFITGDAAKMKEFEAKLGLREFYAEESDEAQKNLMFLTTETAMAQSNFGLVYYVSTPSGGEPFINSVVNFIKNANDFDDPKLKEWFTANGYGNQFTANSQNGYAYGLDATGKILAQVFINDKGDAAMLQIFEETGTQSAVQMRRLASEQYEKAQSRMILKQNELQQLRRR